MVTQFPSPPKGAEKTIKMRMDLAFDVPAKIAEQIEMWGIYHFEHCVYNEERRQFTISACAELYQKGA